ncbi:hypothetical protein BU24DRAFT_386445 [Aaosphaeria arxii CBS 175.79]|uniref:Rhodopsin domain-containing protein n=1 Tax=Aaosphaeria arxii CBS 175.79 TaxID=1450172 RepID=A0A6A5Y3W8_9PLEO|nr:uncharacterized protein BU24DRAFT_386445 [Aaosphaeria arxii CBS 175.79]KAF2019510.1 hypothetical protein BU24DRAFT_386445 [Aaosphaeria arxii CBS 175.79]
MKIIPIEGLNAIAWCMTSLGMILTIGRFWIHWRKTRRIGWDDYFNGVALIFLLAYITTYQIYVPIDYQAQLYALGLSNEPPGPRDVMLTMKLNMANIALFFCVIYSVKASFLAMYWRIFEISKRFRVAWSLLTAYTALCFLVSFTSIFWKCGTPTNFLEPEACAERPRSIIVHLQTMWCSLNVVGDIMLMIIPVAMLKPMLMPLSQKIGVAFVFSLVFIIIAFDILRTVYTLRMSPKFQDENAVWALMEPTIAVIVCALPCFGSSLAWITPAVFNALISSVSNRFSSSSKRSSNSSGSVYSKDSDGTGKDSWLINERTGSV